MIYRQTLSQKDLDSVLSQSHLFNEIIDASVLVTGASGFLSTSIIQLLSYLSLQKGYSIHIVGLTRHPASALNFPNVTYLSYDEVYSPFYHEKFDLIFHCASPSGTFQAASNYVDLFRVNTLSIQSLIRLKRSFNSKLVFFSSGSVYSDSDCIKKSENAPICFDYYTNNAYAIAKLSGETFCKIAYENSIITTYIVRIFHTYGPCMKIPDGRLINDLFYKITQKASLILSGYPDSLRSFCYITDLLRAIFTILTSGLPASPYNIGNPSQVFSAYQFASILSATFPDQSSPVIVKQDSSFINRSTKQRDSIPDISKLMSLGWKPNVNLSIGLEDCFLLN